MIRILLLALAAMLLAAPAMAAKATPGDVPRMTIEQLESRLGDENIVVVDARGEKGWRKSETKVKGATRVSVDYNVPAQIRHFRKDMTYVVYCA